MQRLFHFCFLLLATCPSLLAQDENGVFEKVDHLILNSRFDETLALLDQSTGESPSLFLENKKAEVLTRLGRFEEASQLLEHIRNQVALNPNGYLDALTDTNLGFLQLNQGRDDLAEETLQRALYKWGPDEKSNSREVAQALSHLGLAYMSQGKYSQAQEQLHHALALRQTLTRNKNESLAATYNDLGLAYSQTDKDMALDYYEQARTMYHQLYGDQDPKVATINVNIGIIYRDLELLGDAVNNFETALNIWNRVYKAAHPAKAIALYNLGQTYLQMNDRKNASEFYHQALTMYQECYGQKHPEIASVLNAMGNLSLAESEFEKSLLFYQRALHANVQDFAHDDPKVNPSLKHFYSGTRLLHTLLFKAQAFEAQYTRKTLKFSDLKEALHILTLCDSLIDQLRQHSTNESDKMLLGVMANEVYADGVRVAYLAALNAVRKDVYFERAFYFAEKSKGAVLLESISDANAKAYAGIPQHLLEQERTLKSALTLNARKLAQKPSEEEEISLRENSFKLKNEYETFTRTLGRDYPEYFNLKFNTETPGIRQLQALLNEQTAIISYFIDDKGGQLYIFVVRKQHFKIWQRPLTKDFDKYITGLRNGIYFQELATYKKSAYELNRMLLPPLPVAIADLVIVPAGRLGLVPFEALLTREPEESTPYQDMPFLLNGYGIRYEFSAALLLQKAHERQPIATPSIFLCAPVSFPQRKHLGELPGTEKEVQDISRLFTERNMTSTAYTRLAAEEELLKTGALKGYRYVHFATHGIADESNPELSRIYLQAGANNDGDLFAGEIYNLELNASLVTVSACQTGVGKIMKGEGVIGLSRALVYAGARNIVVSFWNVADESTASLMRDFYENMLQSGGDYSQCLRKAKLKLSNDERYSAPFYWAPFVLIGF